MFIRTLKDLWFGKFTHDKKNGLLIHEDTEYYMHENSYCYIWSVFDMEPVVSFNFFEWCVLMIYVPSLICLGVVKELK